MTVIIFLLALAVAALFVIAAELGYLIREASRGRGIVLKGKRNRETPPAAGQTINVNLSPITGMGSMMTQQIPLQSQENPQGEQGAKQAGEAEKASREEEPPEPIPVIDAPPHSAQQTAGSKQAGGLFAIKCPKCKAENSSYRSECFNCGTAL